MGILLGAGLHLIALIVVLCIAVLMFVLTFAKFSNPNSYLLVVHYDEFCEQSITAELRRSVKNYKLRSKSLTRAGAEMTYEVRLNERHEGVQFENFHCSPPHRLRSIVSNRFICPSLVKCSR